MAPTPKKKPAQTEAKAKGLIGWTAPGKRGDAATSVGDYKGKSLNLTKKQLASAGVKKAGPKVSISDTKWEKGKGVTNTKTGKALNGRVDLGGGNWAVYKNGKRVSVSKGAGSGSSGSTGGRGGSGGTGGTGGTGGAGAAGKPGASSRYGSGVDTTTAAGVAAASKGKGASKPPTTVNGIKVGSIKKGPYSDFKYTAAGKWVAIPNTKGQGKGQMTPAQLAAWKKKQTSMSAAPTPKEGAKRVAIVNGDKQNQVYKGGKWVKR